MRWPRWSRIWCGWPRTIWHAWRGTLTVDPASHAIVAAALEALTAPDPTRTDVDGTPIGDSPTPAQRRADAIVDLCGQVASSGRHPRAHVVVTMTFDSLRERLGFGLTGHGQPLSPETVRQTACDAKIIPMVLGSHGEVLDVGRAVRLATAAQVTALRERDRGCSFPGCDRPPTWCDAHHLTRWIDGGATDLTNLALL